MPELGGKLVQKHITLSEDPISKAVEAPVLVEKKHRHRKHHKKEAKKAPAPKESKEGEDHPDVPRVINSDNTHFE